MAINPAGLHSAVSASEGMAKVREWNDLRTVTVNYEQSYIFAAGFSVYTGVWPDAVGLYRGPLSETIDVPAK